jgi:predicted transglutaminase-like protease|tara:strand:+ start:615 stop:815 length:201 start_codon:yes stop_codon:yes gene_type:complete
MAKLKILMKGSMNVFMVMLIIIALWVLAMVLDNYYDQSMAVTQEMSELSISSQTVTDLDKRGQPSI